MVHPLFELLATVVTFTFVATTAYGAFTHQRNWFTLGICLFSIMPVVGELNNYLMDNELVHLAIILVFIGQIIISLPVKTSYGTKNSSAYALSIKIGLSIFVTNLLHGCFILSTPLNVPHQFGYFHLGIAIILLYSIIKSGSKKDVRWK